MKYVALLRGIGPSNPNMHGAKLRGVLDELGFDNVSTLISSGNVLFESDETDIVKLEAKIQKAWPDKLGFESITIVRSKEQLEDLVAHNPYGGIPHSRENYQLVTFFKKPTKIKLKMPYITEDKSAALLAQRKDAVFSRIDVAATKTPDWMAWLERQFGKDITSRTWKTVNRILQKMG